jgi:hypothetical protein
MNPTLSFLLLTLILTSCNNPERRNQNDGVFEVSFDNCKTSIDLKLSDLVDSYKFVKLETTPESLIGNNPRIILAKDNIIVIDMNGIYKFTADGRFVRKIVKFGRGPEELSSVIDYSYYERSDLLFIADRIQNKDRFQIYDVEKEKFLDPIKKCFPGPWGAFLVYNDSLIMGSMVPVIVDTNRYALFIQNSKGKIITGITNSRKVLDARLNKETVQRLLFYQGEKDIYAFYVYDDTLFRYTPKGLLPYLIVSYNSPRNYMRSMGFKIGESRVNYPSVDNSSFILMNEFIFTGQSKEGSWTKSNYDRYYYFLNKSDRSFSKIKSYTDDITGKIQECNGKELIFPTILPGNKICVLYNPYDLTNIKSKENLSMPPDLFNQLQKIQEGLNPMDNPILLIGSIKKNILID